MNVWDSGRAAFWRTWQWHYRLTHEQESKMRNKIGYTSMPGGPSGRVGTLGGSGLAISRSSTHPQESIELIRYRIQRELQSEKDGSDSQLPDPPELYDLPRILDPYGHSGTTNQQRSAVVARPSMIVGDSYEGVSTAYFEAVHSVLTGERSAPEAAAALERRLVEITGFKVGPPSKGSQSLQ
jgi:trehalose/maltose transport system substrate-binding protein